VHTVPVGQHVALHAPFCATAMSCFADCFCWQREAQDEPGLALLSPAAQPVERQPQRRQRRDTVDFETSKAKLGALANVLDETPRTRAMATDTIIAIGTEDASSNDSDGTLPAKIAIPKRSPLAIRSPNVAQEDAPKRRGKTGFSALSALIEQSPRTRMGTACAGDEEPNFVNAMDVSGLIAIDAADTEDQADEPEARAEESSSIDADVDALAEQAAASLEEAIASDQNAVQATAEELSADPAPDDDEDVMI
jgi:NACalpha-BTF3-like transcription factor